MSKVTVTLTAHIEWPQGEAPTVAMLRDRLLPALDRPFRDFLVGVENTGTIQSTSATVEFQKYRFMPFAFVR